MPDSGERIARMESFIRALALGANYHVEDLIEDGLLEGEQE